MYALIVRLLWLMDAGIEKACNVNIMAGRYDLEGKLIRAPEFEGVQGWDASQVCLTQIQVEAWGPWVFVNLNPEAAPLTEHL